MEIQKEIKKFVIYRFNKSTKDNNVDKALEVMSYLDTKNPDELFSEIGVDCADKVYVWRYASQFAQYLYSRCLWG